MTTIDGQLAVVGGAGSPGIRGEREEILQDEEIFDGRRWKRAGYGLDRLRRREPYQNTHRHFQRLENDLRIRNIYFIFSLLLPPSLTLQSETNKDQMIVPPVSSSICSVTLTSMVMKG